jgi:hypothetical protein
MSPSHQRPTRRRAARACSPVRARSPPARRPPGRGARAARAPRGTSCASTPLSPPPPASRAAPAHHGQRSSPARTPQDARRRTGRGARGLLRSPRDSSSRSRSRCRPGAARSRTTRAVVRRDATSGADPTREQRVGDTAESHRQPRATRRRSSRWRSAQPRTRRRPLPVAIPSSTWLDCSADRVAALEKRLSSGRPGGHPVFLIWRATRRSPAARQDGRRPPDAALQPACIRRNRARRRPRATPGAPDAQPPASASGMKGSPVSWSHGQ